MLNMADIGRASKKGCAESVHSNTVMPNAHTSAFTMPVRVNVESRDRRRQREKEKEREERGREKEREGERGRGRRREKERGKRPYDHIHRR
jgi:hypothetical protein